MRPGTAVGAAFLLTLVTAALWPSAGEGRNGGGREIYVAAAASLTNAIEDLAEEFRRRQGTIVRLDVSSSGLLRRKIEAGCKVDVFISASARDMDILERDGLVASESRVNLLENALVCAVPSRLEIMIASPQGLLQGDVRRVAIGDPDYVPAGQYGKQALSTLQLWHPLRARIVPCANTRASLAQAEAATVEAAIVFATDAWASEKVRVAFTFPAETNAAIVYPAAVLNAAPSPEGGGRFLRFLASSYAQSVFRRHGFRPVAEKAR